MSSADNLYPSDDNYPSVSFPVAVNPPQVDPDEGTTIAVAYNPEWGPVLSAACEQLTQYASWIGTDDEKKLAVNRATNLEILLRTPLAASQVPAPFWDDGTDVEAQEPADTQTWYGEVDNPEAPANEMTFRENAVIWLLTGFVAVSATPAAAIAFRALANRFVLAVKRDDLGEIWRVIVDANDYTTVDTSTAVPGDIVEIPVNGLPDASYHDILLVKVS